MSLSIYTALENMLERFAFNLRRSPVKYDLYEQIRPRLIAMRRSSDIGWGYGDFVRETVDELEELLGNVRIFAICRPGSYTKRLGLNIPSYFKQQFLPEPLTSSFEGWGKPNKNHLVQMRVFRYAFLYG